jgi:hypothetical protein
MSDGAKMPENPLVFPQPVGRLNDNGDWAATHDPGMGLRDYFAAKALQGMLAGIYSDPRETEAGETMETSPGDFMLHARANALNAYAMADAMLTARTAGKESA